MFVQIFASSACTGVVCTISVPNTSNSSAALAPEPSPTPPTMQGSVAITSRPRSANESASGRPTRPRPTTATFMRRRLPGGATSLAQVLARERGHEARVRGQVAAQQPARLLADPVDPLEPVLLHPRGRHVDATRVEV